MRRWVPVVGLIAPQVAWAGACDAFVDRAEAWAVEAHDAVASFLSRQPLDPTRAIHREAKAACARLGPELRACVEAAADGAAVERCLGADPLVWWTWDAAWQRITGGPPDSLGLGHTETVRGVGFRYHVPVSAVPTDQGWVYSYEDLGQGRTAHLRFTVGTPLPPLEALEEAAGAEWVSAARVDYRTVEAQRADGQVQWVVQAKSAAIGGLGVAECVGPRRDAAMLRALCDGLVVDAALRHPTAFRLPRTGLQFETVLGAPARWEVGPGVFTALWEADGGDIALSVRRQGSERPVEVREPPITQVEERQARGTLVFESWAGSDLAVRRQFEVDGQSYRAICEGLVAHEATLREMCTSFAAATEGAASAQERIWWGLEEARVPAEGARRWVPGTAVALDTDHPLSAERAGRAEFGDLAVVVQAVDPVARPLDGAWVHGEIEPVPRPPPHRRGQPKADKVRGAEPTWVALAVDEAGTRHAQALVAGSPTWSVVTCFHDDTEIAERACASARPATDADRAHTAADASLPAYGW